MAKIKFTKNELKKQKDALKRFQRYLPTLQLKKQQLQLEILKIQHGLEEIEAKLAAFNSGISKWVSLFSEGAIDSGIIKVNKIFTHEGNIAGIDIPIFDRVDFKEEKLDLIKMPLWVDYGIEALKEAATLRAQYQILLKQLAVIREELRTTTQRVNLFEKIKIPECLDNIRIIRIFLGDLQTAAVVTGKIAKNKIEEKLEALV